MHTVFACISATLLVFSPFPYICSICEGKTEARLSSWLLWTFIGLTLWLTYSGSAGLQSWVTFFAFTNPLCVTLVIWAKTRTRFSGFTYLEICCGVINCIAMLIYVALHVLYGQDPSYTQIALYICLLADACAAIPTVQHVWKHPEDERPLMWLIFGASFVCLMLSIEVHTFANYALPLYMISCAAIVATPLVRYRITSKAPFSEWY